MTTKNSIKQQIVRIFIVLSLGALLLIPSGALQAEGGSGSGPLPLDTTGEGNDTLPPAYVE